MKPGDEFIPINLNQNSISIPISSNDPLLNIDIPIANPWVLLNMNDYYPRSWIPTNLHDQLTILPSAQSQVMNLNDYLPFINPLVFAVLTHL